MPAIRRLLPLLLLLSAPLLAQNLHPGGNFDDDEGIAGWQATLGTLSHETADESDCPLSGSFRGLCEEVVPGALYSLDATGPCVPLAESGLLNVSWSYQGSGGALPGSVGYFLEAFDNATCAGGPVASLGFNTFEIFPWQFFEGVLPVTAGGSIRMHVDADGLDGCVGDLDRIEVTLGEHLLLDDLDGGGTCRWSSSLPG